MAHNIFILNAGKTIIEVPQSLFFSDQLENTF